MAPNDPLAIIVPSVKELLSILTALRSYSKSAMAMSGTNSSSLTLLCPHMMYFSPFETDTSHSTIEIMFKGNPAS